MIKNITITPKFIITEKEIWDMIDYDNGSTCGVAEHINNLTEEIHELKMTIVQLMIKDNNQEKVKNKTKQKNKQTKNIKQTAKNIFD